VSQTASLSSFTPPCSPLSGGVLIAEYRTAHFCLAQEKAEEFYDSLCRRRPQGVDRATAFPFCAYSTAHDPKATFEIGALNGREARESGLWLTAWAAPT
jgi:hypothetical protein